jgi:Lon-like protease
LKFLKFLLKRKWYFLIPLLLIVIFTYPLPYYITQPGSAQELDPIIEVEDANDGSGEFMLTTVLVGKGNIVSLAIAKMSDYYHIYPEEIFRQEGEDEKEYNVRQLELMHSAKNTATAVAYHAADKEFEVINKGILVTNRIAGMPAAEQLKAGDVITAVGGTSVQTVEQLNEAIASYKLNDKFSLTIIREGIEETLMIGLAKFPDDLQTDDTKDVYGLGILYPITMQEIITDPLIEIDTDDIGGPSAGLMFSLEIFNQLTEIDYTKGYRIAGTGTISFKGDVGPIGGIKQKVVAADNAEADIFFAPVAEKNYEDALEAAKDIETEMKVVPVKNFEDALEYLEKLQAK